MVTIILAITDSNILSVTFWILGGLVGVLIGVLVYVWKSALTDIKERLDKTEKEIMKQDQCKVSKEDYQKNTDLTIQAVHEVQAQLLNLSERITQTIIEFPKEFAKEENCQLKHRTMEVMLSQVQLGVTEMIKKMDNLSDSIQNLKIWQSKVDMKVGTGPHDAR